VGPCRPVGCAHAFWQRPRHAARQYERWWAAAYPSDSEVFQLELAECVTAIREHIFRYLWIIMWVFSSTLSFFTTTLFAVLMIFPARKMNFNLNVLICCRDSVSFAKSILNNKNKL
jgi:hypothetical protein